MLSLKKIALRNHTEAIQSLSWKHDGSLLVTTAKDLKKRFENIKTANKDSKVVWISTSDCILSSVYSQVLKREILMI